MRVVITGASDDLVEVDGDNYTDQATITGDIKWIVYGNEIAKAAPA